MFGVPVTGVTDTLVTYWLAIDRARCLPWGNATRKGGRRHVGKARLGSGGGRRQHERPPRRLVRSHAPHARGRHTRRLPRTPQRPALHGGDRHLTPAPLVPRRTSLRRRRPAHELGRALRRLPPLQPSRARGPRFHPDALPAVR